MRFRTQSSEGGPAAARSLGFHALNPLAIAEGFPGMCTLQAVLAVCVKEPSCPGRRQQDGAQDTGGWGCPLGGLPDSAPKNTGHIYSTRTQRLSFTGPLAALGAGP